MAKKGSGAGGMWGTGSGASLGLLPGRRTVGPLLLVLLPPLWVTFLQFALREKDGSLLEAARVFVDAAREQRLVATALDLWPSPFSPAALRFLAVFASTELLLMRILPGKEYRGPVTPKGNVPVYRANGMQAWTATVVLFAAGVWGGAFSGGVVYDVMSEMVASTNLFSLFFCLFLYVKGRWFPSSSDSAHTGNFVFDYFEGVELYPRIFGWDVKQFTNCRFGMMFWGIAPISFALKQQELYGHISDSMLVSVCIQLVYVSKFFWWETGYFSTIDIMHDRAGFMLCWGCMVWLPVVYTVTAQFLVEHPIELGSSVALGMVGAGLLSVVLNYVIDAQRETFRNKNGKVTIWGKPAQFITATYTPADGRTRTSLLLTSGWWGLCRKFNYTLELLAAFSWSVPALFSHLSPYFYFVFLVVLLVDRAYRDDARCRSKYGAKWDEYCRQVPHMLVPGVF